MNNKVIENHKKYLERKTLLKSFGYDIDKEREFVLDQAKPVSGRILEAGTGKGHFALALAKAGHSFVSFDISAEEQRFAELNIAHFGYQAQVDLRIENGERTSFLNNSFDLIFSVNVLHHLNNPYRVIDELIRIVSFQGRIVLTDFTDNGFKLMDKIHRLEGNSHHAGQVVFAEVESYLMKKKFLTKKAKSRYQWVLIAERGSV